MVTLLPGKLPEQVQGDALNTFDAYHSDEQELPPLASAWDWFKLQVYEDLEKEHLRHLGTHFKLETEVSDVSNKNSDIHIDGGLFYLIRYVMTICAVPDASTIYFPDGLSKDMLALRPTSHEWFDRDVEQHRLHITRRHDESSPRYVQAQNGQVSRFNTETDYHSAAPLPCGTKKILFSCKTFVN